MAGPYRVYCQTSPDYNASVYYRMLLPMSLMERMGLPVDCLYDWSDCSVDPRKRVASFMESDIDLIYQSTGAFRLELMKKTAEFKPMKDREGERRWPPTMIVDTDDDLFNVQPLNLTFGSNGTKRPDGTLLEDGDVIGIAHPTEIVPPEMQERLHATRNGPLPNDRATIDGKTYTFCADGQWRLYILLWQDGRNCDLAANRNRVEMWRNTLKAAHLVTCSTPRVAEYVKRETSPDLNTFVAYNAINFDEYPDVELADHPQEVRVLWQGSATHHEDLWPLNDSLARVARKYPNTTWWFWGAPYEWAMRNIPRERMKLIPWLHFEAYKTRLSTINHDINLAPLAPHTFNQSRSAIKWYESSAICKPAATLAQNTGPYADEIVEGETGLLFSTPEEFETKLGALIEDATLRKTLASNAKDWVRTNRDARKLITALFRKWVETREAHKLTMPFDESVLSPSEEEREVALST